jgi:hypothetical protein
LEVEAGLNAGKTKPRPSRRRAAAQVTVYGSPYRARRNELLHWHYTGIGLARADSILHTTLALNGGAMQAVQDALDVTCETVKTLRATVAAVIAAVISAAVGLPLRFIVLFRGRRIFLRHSGRRNA